MGEWRTVFWVTFAVFAITTVVYVIWAAGEVQPWNEPEGEEIVEEGGVTTMEGKVIEPPTSVFTTTVLGVETVLSDSKALEAAKSDTTKDPVESVLKREEH